MNANNTSKLTVYFLDLLQVFIGLTVIAGGFRLISNPSVISDFPIKWLSNLSLTKYFIPVLVLLAVIGFGNVLAGTINLFHKKFYGGIAAVLAAFLILYMIIELWFVGLPNFLQPFIPCLLQLY